MANGSQEIEVEGIGKVTISHSDRARHISIRIRNGEVILVIPRFGRVSDALSFLEKKRAWVQQTLRKSRERSQSKGRNLFDENREFKTLTFSLRISRSEGQKFIISLKDDILHILCPKEVKIEAENVQELIKKSITNVIRREAQRILPARLKELADRHGFKYSSCTIRDTRTRWGSCNGKGDINLNLFLMCLPEHLIDYVLIHELCHTVELNHGPRFWALVDGCTGKPHELFRKEMQNYHPGL